MHYSYPPFRREENEAELQVSQKKPNQSVDKPSERFYISPVTNPISEAARLLGSIKTPKRAKASRENGKLGGRPPKRKKTKGKRAA